MSAFIVVSLVHVAGVVLEDAKLWEAPQCHGTSKHTNVAGDPVRERLER